MIKIEPNILKRINTWLTPAFDAETQETMVSYLSANYGPKEDARRTSLDPLLMPKNPYKKILQPQVVNPKNK